MSEFGFAASVLIGAIFGVSGISKIRAGTFSRDLARYRLLPEGLVPPVAAVIPWVEILLGVGLLALGGLWIFLSAAAAMLTLFSIAVAVTLLRGNRIACGCRANGQQVSWQLVATNAVLIVVCLTSLKIPSQPGLITTIAGHGLSMSQAMPSLIALAATASIVRVVSVWSKVLQRLNSAAPSHPR